MYNFPQRTIFLFTAAYSVSASRWWRDTGYDGDLLNDAAEPSATLPPRAPYQRHLDAGTPPINGTIGHAIYHFFESRQLGCGACIRDTPTCCNNGTFCCAGNSTCQAGWCCPFGTVACPGTGQQVCLQLGQICCGSGVCERGSRCCGGLCCDSDNTCTEEGQCLSRSQISSLSLLSLQSLASLASQTSPGGRSSTVNSSSSSETSTSVVVPVPPSPSDTATVVTDPPIQDPETTSSVTISDPPQVEPSEETATLDTPSESSFVDLPSDPIVDPPSFSFSVDPPSPSVPIDPVPSDPFTPVDSPSAADDPPPSSSVVVATPISSSVTRTVSRTVAPQVLTAPTNTATNLAAVEEPGDVIALVYPWDPRIQYSPESAWVSTTSSSSVGTCRNGTKVASAAEATIKFDFEGKQIAALICKGSKGGQYGVKVDSAPATNLDGYKDPGINGDECILSETFNSGMLTDGGHSITVIVKGARGSGTAGGTAVEFGGFIYRGPRASGTAEGSKTNIPAIIGGTVGGVLGGILILTIIVVIVIRRKRRNGRVDDAPAVHTIPITAGTPYSAVPTTEYHDPYANSGYGPTYYPNPTATPPSQAMPAWRQTDQGPFGQGSYVSGH